MTFPSGRSGERESSRRDVSSRGRGASELRAGAALTYAAVFAQYLINFLLTPLLLRSLGQAGFGLYSLVGAFVAYLATLDFGIGNAIVRYVAKFRAENDRTSEFALVGLCVRVYSGIALLALGVGAVVYGQLGAIFGGGMGPGELSEARRLFALMVANLAISFPLGTFQAVIIGHERFVFLRTVAIGRVVVRAGVLVALLLLGYKAVAIVLVDTAVNVLVGVLNIVYVRSRLGVRLASGRLEPGFLREMLSYSGLVFLNIIVDALYWRVGHVVLGAMVGTYAVALFALAMQVVSYYREVLLAISSVFLPRITGLVVAGVSEDGLLEVFARVARIQLIIAGWVLGAFLLFGRDFLVLWAGGSYDASWALALVILVPLTVPMLQAVGVHILQAKNMHGFRSFMYLGVAAANIALSVILVRRLGPLGAALATSACLVLGDVVLINLYYHRRVRLNVFRLTALVSRRLAPAIGAALLLGAAARYVPGHSWGSLVLKGSLFTALYAVMMWLFGMNGYEKGLVREMVGWLGRGSAIVDLTRGSSPRA